MNQLFITVAEPYHLISASGGEFFAALVGVPQAKRKSQGTNVLFDRGLFVFKTLDIETDRQVVTDFILRPLFLFSFFLFLFVDVNTLLCLSFSSSLYVLFRCKFTLILSTTFMIQLVAYVFRLVSQLSYLSSSPMCSLLSSTSVRST